METLAIAVLLMGTNLALVGILNELTIIRKNMENKKDK